MQSDPLDKMPANPWGQSRGEKMGSDYRSQKRQTLTSFRKVSKPLMEKKRRARINLSLEQLKVLLEKHYSHQIRKRKLEKADILELSVKYMKSLQHPVQGPPPPRSAEYQAGFRSCLQGVRQFLLRSSEGDRASFQLLHELARALLPAVGGGSGFSSTDSVPGLAAEATAVAAASVVLQEPCRAHEASLPPLCRKARPPQAHPRGTSQVDTIPPPLPAPGRGWSQARSGQGLPERNPGLWRPW